MTAQGLERRLPAVARSRPTAERLLLGAARRPSEASRGLSAIVLHMSRVPTAAAPPHRRRIALVLLQDAARRHDGQLFELRNGDLVLLCPAWAPGAAALPATLQRLVGSAELVSVWPLEHAQDRLVAYATARLGDEDPAEDDVQEPDRAATDAATALIRTVPVGDLARQQSAILLGGQGNGIGLLFGRSWPFHRGWRHCCRTGRVPP